ncbi:MAG: response regulator [Bacteroidales bacterium]|nr:response regulator [Bacteroidales bacterium]
MKKIFLPLLLLFYLTATLKAQDNYADNYLFSYITVNYGLTNNFTDGIYKDSRGFLWISTVGGGLLRYDGYTFTAFNNRSAYPLKSNFIRDVVEDNFHRLWIASESGLDIMELKNYQKSPILNEEEDVTGVFSTPKIKLLKDSGGHIWATSANSITRFDLDSEGNIIKINTLRQDTKITSPITAIFEFDSQMLVGINNIVSKITVTDKGELVAVPFSNLLKLDCINIKCMEKKENELWIGTDNGLVRFSPENETLKIYVHSDSKPESLSQNLISDLAVSKDGVLIAATLKGLNFYDPLTDGFKHVNQSEKEIDFRSLNCDFVNTIFCDDKILWIGTERGGLNKMIKPVLSVKNYQNSVTDQTTISKGCVNSIFVDKKENLWVGVIEGGLNLKEKNSDKFQHFTVKDGLSHNSVSYISEIDSNTLLLGTWGGGLTIFDKKQKRGIKTIDPETDEDNLTHGIDIHFTGVAIKDTINNGFWIGSTGGIFFYDPATNEFTDFFSKEIREKINGCLGATITQNGNLLIGTTIGLIAIDLHTVRSKILNYSIKYPKVNDHTTDFLSKITYIYQHTDGNIFFGTDGYGLVEYNHETKNYDFITTDNALANDIVCLISQDDNGLVWIATANGISCYSPNSKRITNYYKHEGLCDNQFFWNGCFKNPFTRNIFFGSMHGLVEIDPERYNNNPALNQVFLTGLKVNDEYVLAGDGEYIKSDITSVSDIYVHEKDRSVLFEFSALDYHWPEAIVYQYKLEGYDPDWKTDKRHRRAALYTNLTPGTYTFCVRCATGQGDFSQPTRIRLHVARYFYKQWWFMILAALAGFAIINLIIRWRVENLKRQKTHLENEVNKRTSALESKSEELARQNEILFSQNEEISRQKNQMEKMTRKIQELTVDKLAFFTNITHEFRTPLTLIIGPIERALKLSTNPKVIEQLNFVNNNSKHLLSLVNQLMDFRKVETGNMPISLQPGNFATFVDDVLLPFRALAEENKIKINCFQHLKNPFIMFDREAMTKILTNLVSNALKFSPPETLVNVYAASLKNSQKVYLAVSDQGKGIIKEDVEKIFNSFYQSKNQADINADFQQGTGIGLYVCKRLANLLGGDIFAKNNRSKGASFRMTIPLTPVQTEETAPASGVIEHISVNEYDDEIDDSLPEDSAYRLSVLVVEDNSEMRHYIRSILSDTYTVIEASDGKNALQVLKTQTVDLILSDLMMPEMNGLQLAKEVKADINISHIPIIILTAKTSRDSQLESFRSGVDDYVTKPFDEVVLKAKILSLIENRKKYGERFRTDMEIESLNISEDSADKKLLDKALKIVKENYKDSGFDITELAEALSVTKAVLNKKLQALTKQSANQFIRNYRLKIAHDLIIKNKITHNMNISEIAWEVGFNDPKYFTRCFTKHFGVTPSSVGEEK